MRLKWGLGDFVRIGAGFTPFPLEVGVVLKPQSNKTLVLIRGEKKEYPNDGLEYVRPQDVEKETVGDIPGVSQQDGEWEFEEGAFDEETEFYVPTEDSTMFSKAKEYGKEILSFIGIAIVIVLVVLFARWKEPSTINEGIDKEVNSNNAKISELFEIRKEIDDSIDELKKRNIKLYKAKVDVSIN